MMQPQGAATLPALQVLPNHLHQQSTPPHTIQHLSKHYHMLKDWSILTVALAKRVFVRVG